MVEVSTICKSENRETHGLVQKLDRQLSALLRDVNYQHFVVALSGGSDSMALLMLLREYCQNRDIALTAVTIDHKLREESSQEAKQVGQWMSALEVSHKIRSWNHQGGIQGNLQAAARQVRYQLLAEVCRELKASILLTGHTEDDQAETVALRQQRGSNVVGLAGMAASRALNSEVRLLRPLLSIGREALRGYLKEYSIPWVDEPSNENEAFDRIKIRKYLQQHPEEKRRLLAIANKMGTQRREIEIKVNQWLQRYVQQESPRLNFKCSALNELTDEIDNSTPNSAQYMALCRILQSVGEKDTAPRYQKVQNLFHQLVGEESGVTTLAFCRVEWERGMVAFTAEKPGIQKENSLKSLVEEPFYPIYLAS